MEYKHIKVMVKSHVTFSSIDLDPVALYVHIENQIPCYGGSKVIAEQTDPI